MRHNATVALLSRCEALALVERRRNERDGRVVEVHLRPLGQRYLSKLAALHEAELHSLEGTFRVARITSFNDQGTDAAQPV
jgi:DNA-binding MarR family transcriptional regulator